MRGSSALSGVHHRKPALSIRRGLSHRSTQLSGTSTKRRALLLSCSQRGSASHGGGASSMLIVDPSVPVQPENDGSGLSSFVSEIEPRSTAPGVETNSSIREPSLGTPLGIRILPNQNRQHRAQGASPIFHAFLEVLGCLNWVNTHSLGNGSLRGGYRGGNRGSSFAAWGIAGHGRHGGSRSGRRGQDRSRSRLASGQIRIIQNRQLDSFQGQCLSIIVTKR